MRSVNFTVSGEGKVTEYTFKCEGDRLSIVSYEPPIGDGDTRSSTETQILPMSSTKANVIVEKEKKNPKIILSILVMLAGIVVAVMSMFGSEIARGPLSRFLPVWPMLCYGVGGFIIIAGIFWFIYGLMQAKKSTLTTINITSKGELVKTVQFLDNKNADIANAVINFFKQ